MAQEKGKNILTGPPMNPPPRSSPFGELHGCDGDGCASDLDIWPLHHVLRRGVHCRLCYSCIILSHRSLYCCRCFLLVTSPSCNYDNGDTLMAPPAPTVTCQVCREAVAHLPCLYPAPADGVFVCPPCTAAQNGRPFTYAPPCRQPLDERNARVLVLAARIALAQLQRHETAARATADRLVQEARDARARAHDALIVALNLGAEEDPSWVVPQPQSDEDDLAASEEEGSEAEADVGEVLLVRRNAMPPLAMLTIGKGASVVPMAPAEAKHTPATLTIGTGTSVVPMAPAGANHTPATLTIGTGASVVPMAPAKAKHTPSSQSKLLFDLNVNAAENEAEAAQAEPTRHWALNSFDVKEVAMAAAEAARASPPTPQTLQLFPSAKASSSTKRPRTLQLFNDDEEEI